MTLLHGFQLAEEMFDLDALLDMEEVRDFVMMDSLAKSPEAASSAAVEVSEVSFKQRMVGMDLQKLIKANAGDVEAAKVAYRKAR
jgi:hypothetical protein